MMEEEVIIEVASVPLEQRVVAASVGALLTSLASNPLDVVKTRLQVRRRVHHAPAHDDCQCM